MRLPQREQFLEHVKNDNVLYHSVSRLASRHHAHAILSERFGWFWPCSRACPPGWAIGDAKDSSSMASAYVAGNWFA